MLTVNHLTLSVRRQPLLREVAFSVAPGEVLTLMGPSGSGKSTLFAWMIGALSGDFRARGELWLNERRCDTLPTEHRRIGILFQDPLLFDHFSVGQNLQLALPGDGALAMKDNSVQTCVTAKKSAPGEWRIRPPLFTVGHFDETCFSIDRTRPAHGACCFHYLRR